MILNEFYLGLNTYLRRDAGDVAIYFNAKYIASPIWQLIWHLGHRERY